MGTERLGSRLPVKSALRNDAAHHAMHARAMQPCKLKPSCVIGITPRARARPTEALWAQVQNEITEIEARLDVDSRDLTILYDLKQGQALLLLLSFVAAL